MKPVFGVFLATMTRRQAADTGDDFELSKVLADILRNSLRHPTRNGTPIWGLCIRINISRQGSLHVTKPQTGLGA